MTRASAARWTVWVAAAALVASAGCEKTAVKSSVSPCFRVLPQAHRAIGSQGTFVDVARRTGAVVYPSSGGPAFTPTAPTSEPPTTSARPMATGPPNGASAGEIPELNPNDPRRDVCIIAYRGSFDPNRISLLRGPERTGRYAVVIVGVRSQQVRAVVLSDRLPRALHRH